MNQPYIQTIPLIEFDAYALLSSSQKANWRAYKIDVYNELLKHSRDETIATMKKDFPDFDIDTLCSNEDIYKQAVNVVDAIIEEITK